MKKFSKLIIKVLAGFFGYVALCNALYKVDQTKQAVITQFGKPVRVIVNPVKKDEDFLAKLKDEYKNQGIKYSEGAGLKVKIPFIQDVNYFERRILAWDGFPEQIPTKDKKYIWVDTTARWYINDPLKFLQTVRTEDTANARLDDIIDSLVRDSITGRVLPESVRNSNRELTAAEQELEENVKGEEIKEGREKITKEVYENARKACAKFGIEVIDVRIKGINYVDSVKEKVFDRMIAERERIAERYRSEGQGETEKIMGKKELDFKTIMSEAYRKAQIIKGNADGQATKIYAEAYNKDPEFYQFLKTLEIYQNQLGDKTKLIIGTDNELLKYLKDYSPKDSKKK